MIGTTALGAIRRTFYRCACATLSAESIAVMNIFPIWKRALHAFALVFCLTILASHSARANIGVTVTSDQATFARGRANTFVFHLALSSEEPDGVREGADNIHFHFPDGVTVSALRYHVGSFTCPDAFLLLLGIGTNAAGWFNPDQPSSCGYFVAGIPQTFSVDADVPAGYSGDLPVVINVDGDGLGPLPHEAQVTVTFADGASPAGWNFDDVEAPALPVGWATEVIDGGIVWRSIGDGGGSAPNSAYAPTPARSGESSLTSPSIAIDATGGEFRFRHRFSTELNRDGGVIEIAIDDGDFQDMVGAGGVFREGSYNSEIELGPDCQIGDPVPLLGRRAWSGRQEGFTTVAMTLPAAAAGHQARFRWRLGTDCLGQSTSPNGWWIDGVTVTSNAPQAVIGPDKLAVSLDINAQREETVGIANIGGGALSYTVTTAAADGDCTKPAAVSWLHVNDDGTVAGGERARVPVRFDSTTLPTGSYTAQICVATTDGTAQTLAIPVSFDVAGGTCDAPDRMFANGFDDSSDGRCGGSLRTFSRREAFLSETAEGFAEDHYTGLRTGNLRGPIEFGNGTFMYSVFTQAEPLNPSLRLFPGSGVLSTTSSADQLTLTFSGDPVTALGGNFWGGQFFVRYTSIVSSTTVVLTLDDGTREVFTSNGLDGFRGFVSTRPIKGLSISTPDSDENGDIPWGVVDDLVVGRAR